MEKLDRSTRHCPYMEPIKLLKSYLSCIHISSCGNEIDWTQIDIKMRKFEFFIAMEKFRDEEVSFFSK